MDLGLKDATAVVVGGGRGMELAAARCLADDGCRVALVGRTRAVLDQAVQDLASRGSPDAIAVAADIGDAAPLDNAVGPSVVGSLEALPHEIGPVVAFLASRRKSHMTGANVNVDGGSDFT